MTEDVAMNVMEEAHVNALAVVIICIQNHAEEHCGEMVFWAQLSQLYWWLLILYSWPCIGFSECKVYVQMG